MASRVLFPRRGLWLGLCAGLAVVSTPSHALSAAPYSGAVNEVVAKAIAQAAIRNAQSTAAVRATLVTVGGAAGRMALTMGASSAGAVLWPVLLGVAGWYGYQAYQDAEVNVLGVSGNVQWEQSSGVTTFPQARVSGAGLTVDPSAFGVMPGAWADIWAQYPSDGGFVQVWYLKTAGSTQFRTFRVTTRFRCVQGQGFPCAGTNTSLLAATDSTFASSYAGPYPGPSGYWSRVAVLTTSTGTTFNDCSGTSAIGSLCAYHRAIFEFIPATGSNPAPQVQPQFKPVDQAVADIPQSLGDVYLSDEQIAWIANKLWAATSAVVDPATERAPAPEMSPNPLLYPEPLVEPAPGFVPYTQLGRVVPSDVAAIRSGAPTGTMPKVKDFVSPVAPPASNTVPMPAPGDTAPNPNPGTPGTTQIDWGTFSPADPQGPEIPQILDPIWTLWGAWVDWSTPAHASECPVPHADFKLAGRDASIDFVQACDWVQRVRTPIELAFALLWSFTCFLVVVKA